MSQSSLAPSARTRALCALPTKYRTSAKREVELRTSRSSTTTKTTTTHRRRRPPPGIPQYCNSRFPSLRHIEPTCRRLARRRSSERARGPSRPRRHRSGILLMTSLNQRKSVYQRRRRVAIVLQMLEEQPRGESAISGDNISKFPRELRNTIGTAKYKYIFRYIYIFDI